MLATLGVYFGLVLAGATPQVLAQAAMARQFDVKDEIEKKDDLDNKPPDKFAASVQVYLEDVEYFLSGLQRLRSDHKFDIEANKFVVAQATLLPCVADNRAGSYTAEKFFSSNQSLRPARERFSKLLTDGFSLQDCLPSEKFPGLETTSSRFETKYDGQAFSVEVAVRKSSPERAAKLAYALSHTLSVFRKSDASALRINLIDNTTARAKHDQVFVITRLPRAGLDAMLAVNAE